DPHAVQRGSGRWNGRRPGRHKGSERTMRREVMIQRLRQAAAERIPWGIAVDAAARGLTVALVEAHDFGKGTSSRSTKLVHGGVRYLEQGNIPLVMSALKERGLLRQNAPH